MDNNSRNKETIVTDAGKVDQHKDVIEELPELEETTRPRSISDLPKIEESTYDNLITRRTTKVKKATIPKGYDLKSDVYSEPQNTPRDELEYERNKSDQGLVIIFNQKKFQDESEREGTTKDVNDIIFTLGRLGYNIDEQYIFIDFTTKEILEKINEISRENLSTRNSLILFFFTHGSSNDTLMTNDGTIEAKQMWKILGEHKDLQNKPKLFVFQACKGNDISTSFDKKMHENKHYSISSISLSDYPLPPDVLLCYSSVEGMKAYRNTVKGSWFIQEVCRNFMMYGRRDDVISLFTRVAKCVSTYTHIETKQMPSFISTLSRKFYLSKSKDRSNKIAIHEQYHKIYTALKEIETRIEIYEKNHNIK
ncbi:caspase [Holotrichia oblita]|uniref:Caspase n=1 Tax=Holotrichia oblita TaxID=644536 RepID=A0ACB9TUY7_HOLOL|nr:caspase [Holotrichia oblita]